MASVTMEFDFGIFLTEGQLIELSDKITDFTCKIWPEEFAKIASDKEKKMWPQANSCLVITNTDYVVDKTTVYRARSKK